MKSFPVLPPLQNKDYGPNCSDEELGALKSWTYLYEKEIVVIKPPPIMSEFALQVSDDRLKALTADLKFFDLVIDLTGKHERPNADMRARIRQQFINLGKVRRVKAVTGANWLANIAAQFIFNTQGLPPVTVHRTFEQALEAFSNDNSIK